MRCPKFSESGFFTTKYNCSKGINSLERSDNPELFDAMSQLCKSNGYQQCPLYTGRPVVERCRVEPWHDCDIGSPSRSPNGCDGAWCAPWSRYISRKSDYS
jgi:hypothetical protein